MTEAEKADFAAALAELALLRPAGLKLTREHYSAWWNAMRHDWTLEDFRRACAVIAQSVEDIVIGPQHFAALRKKAATETSGEAWEKVLAAIRRMNHHERVSIDPRTDAVVRQLGGYWALAMTDSDEMPWRAKAFAEQWETVGEVEEARAALPNLTGGARLTGPQSTRDALRLIGRQA